MSKKKKPYMGYNKPVPANVKAVPVKKDEFEIRYVLVDTDTGEIIDDAQGYGYKTQRKAYAAFSYKSRPKEKFYEEQAVKSAVQYFREHHPSVCEDIQEAQFYALKEGRKLTENDILSLIPADV